MEFDKATYERLTDFRRPKRRFSQLKPELLSITALSCYAGHVSASRLVMDGAHWSQRVCLINPEIRRFVSSGLETEMAKYLDDVRVPEDCTIKAIVHKYDDQEINPESIALIEYYKDDVRYMDLIVIPRYKSKHSRHGYKLTPTEVITDSGLNNEFLPEGTILARTNSYDVEDGEHMFGVNLNVIAFSDPEVSEDGVVFSESAIEKLTFSNLISTVIDLSANMIPSNLYGSTDYFGMFPEIGETVDTGIMFVSKRRNDKYALVDLNNKDICSLNTLTGVPVVVPAGSKIVDIKVTKGRSTPRVFCSRMTEQLDKYAQVELEYANKVVRMVERYQRDLERKLGHFVDIEMGHTFCMIMKEKEDVIAINDPKFRRKLSVRNKEIDQYRIEIITYNEEKFNLGKKTADLTGSKGTAVNIRPDHLMPFLTSRPDVRADIIMDGPTARTSRMNYPGTYTGYLGALSQDNLYRYDKELAKKYGKDYLETMPDEMVDYIWRIYLDMVSYINPEQEEYMLGMNEDQRFCMVQTFLTNGPRFIQRTDNEFEITEVIDCLEETPYAPFYDTISFYKKDGTLVTTEEKTVMANDYFIMLDRTTRDFSAVFSAMLNHFMIPVKGSDADRRKYSHSKTPMAADGETEQRTKIANAPPVLAAEINDLSANPETHKMLLRHINNMPVMFDEEYDIDRELIPYGNSRPLNITKHVYRASGIELTYQEDDYSNNE